MDIHASKQLFLFDSYGFTGFKIFITDDDKSTINKILYSINKFNKKDDIVTLISLTFSVDAYENLNLSELTKLSATAADLFHVINEFGKIHKIKNEIVLYLVDECKNQRLTLVVRERYERDTISKVLNKIFSLDREENVSMVEKFAKEYEITRS